MYCKRCGKVIPDYAATCPSCGSMTAEAAAAGGDEVSLGDWMLTLFLAAIPLVGFILLLVWAFSGGTNPSKQNWARAILVWAVIAILLAVIMTVASFTLLAGALGRI